MKIVTDINEQEYDSTKYVSNNVNFVESLEKYGVAVIPTILDNEEIDKMRDGMWEFLQHITQKFDQPIIKEKPETWCEIYKLFMLHSQLIQHWQISSAQFIWDLRQNPKIVDIFARLWKVKPEELLVSFDGASIHMPPEVTNRGYFRNNQWYHTDQKLSDSTFKCIQSWVNLFPVNLGDATLTFLEGSHKFHSEFAKEFGKTTLKDDWYKLNDIEMKWFLAKGCQIKSITCPAGSLVLWDSRLFHSAKESIKDRPEANFRCVVYLCYTPRSLATEALLKKKIKAFNEQRVTSHWPHKPKLFPKNPRTYGAELPNVTELPMPILNELGRKLAGF